MKSFSSDLKKCSSPDAPWNKYITENIKNGDITKLFVHCGTKKNTKSFSVCTRNFVKDSLTCSCAFCVNKIAKSSSLAAIATKQNTNSKKSLSKIGPKNNSKKICKITKPSKVIFKSANSVPENKQIVVITENVNVSQLTSVPKFSYSKVISNNSVKASNTNNFVFANIKLEQA